jgi:4-hydroxy-2-oxoheptanedioate aldolase
MNIEDCRNCFSIFILHSSLFNLKEVIVLRENKLREMMKQGKPTVGTRMLSPWPGIMEIIGHCGEIDYVEFSSEYAPYDLHDLENLARASELFEMSTMMKVDQEPRGYLAQRAIGSGIQNILFADVRTVEDAHECVRIVRAETPETKGINGCSMRRHVGYLKECGSPAFVQAMEDAVVAIMVEKKSAVENLEEILSVEGIDMVQFGPCDYSLSIGLPGQWEHPKVKEAELRVIKTALEMGVAPRAEINGSDEAKKYIDLGVRDFNIGVDVVILHNFLKNNGVNLRKELSNLK